MPIHDKLMDYFTKMDKEDNTLMVNEGGQKVDLFQSAAKKAKDIYYQTLFSGGEKAMPLVEKAIGTEAPHKAELLLRYLSGSGEDIPLSEDQGVTDEYLQNVDKFTSDDEWSPTTNRELNPDTGIPYADEGWEYTQIEPEQYFNDMINKTYTDPLQRTALYDKLGLVSTVRRRKLEGGQYEYMVVEPWDLLRGSGEETTPVDRYGKQGWSEPNQPPRKRQDYKYSGRFIPKELAFLAKLAPDFIKHGEYGQTDRININLSDYGKDWFENKAKSFNITGRSIIKHQEQEILPYEKNIIRY